MHSTADKSPEAFRTISEVAEELDVPQHVLRFWESKFGSVRPLKRGGGRRYYRPDDLDLLRGIRSLLHSNGLTIKGVQKLLRERGARYVMELGRDSISHLGAHKEAVSLQAEPLVEDAEQGFAEQASNIHQFPVADRSLSFERVEPEGGYDANQAVEADDESSEGNEIGETGLTGSEWAYFSDLLDELIEIRERLREARQSIRQI